MPRLVPDAADLARMTPAQKAKIRRFIAQVALELDAVAVDIVNARAAERERDVVAWAESIRQHARNLEAASTPEPSHITAQRRQELLNAIR